MVKSKKIYSPAEYLELITGFGYIVRGDDDVEFIEQILKSFDFNYDNYSLCEIDRIVENNLDVVLVECEVWNENKRHYEHEYRWFGAPKDTYLSFEKTEE